LQRYMVKYLNRVGRQDDAIRWVVYCKMDKRDVPYSVQELLTETKIREAEDKISKMRKCSRDPVSVNLFENHPVLMVDTVAGLLELIPVLDQATIVGIDSEWKPMFMSTVEKVALLQISIHTCSYLVDVIKLEQEVSQEQWTEFFEALFCRESNIKLGFDFANDMRVLKTSFPFLESMQPNMKNVICVMKLAISLMSENPTLLSLPEGILMHFFNFCFFVVFIFLLSAIFISHSCMMLLKTVW
uniref:Exonuclease mut-7 homolog (inferred by orthology to a human protein) n=1 Tax=Anisakis simplex TaxID=6269 RepID=A0A0M3J3K7_ANISI